LSRYVLYGRYWFRFDDRLGRFGVGACGGCGGCGDGGGSGAGVVGQCPAGLVLAVVVSFAFGAAVVVGGGFEMAPLAEVIVFVALGGSVAAGGGAFAVAGGVEVPAGTPRVCGGCARDP
jgi:hypothetical protein